MKSGDRVKHELRLAGSSLKTWAKSNGFPYRAVSDVVRGVNKGAFGRGRVIAEKLGLKESSEMS